MSSILDIPDENPAQNPSTRNCCQFPATNAECQYEIAFSRIFNASSDLITLSRLDDGTLVDVNDSFLRATGYERHEVIGESLARQGLWPPACDCVNISEALHRGPVRDAEITFTTRAGHRRTGRMTAESILLRDQQCLLMVVRDITEARQTDAKLGYLNAVVERSSESVIITGMDGKIAYVNPAFTQITGYTRAEAVGQNPRLLKSGKQDGALYQDLWQTILAGRIWHGEMINRRKDGSPYIQETTIIPLQDDYGATNHFIAIGLDITDQRKTEEQLRQAQKMEFVGRLAGGVAHDFNNVLTVINGYGQLLKESLPDDSSLHAYCEEVLKAGDRAAGLTRQLLAFSRRQAIEPQVLDLNSVIADMGKMLTRLIGEDIELVTVLCRDLWAVKADRGQIEQVIINLAVNARDAMPQGGKLAIQTVNRTLDEVFVRSHPGAAEGPQVMLAVNDTGIGMNAETLSHIFEPFFTTKPEGKGTGLGLATAYGIVKQNGGSIWADSKRGRGSTFKVFLPRCGEPLSTAEPPGPRSESLTGAETVLVVDDEPSIRSLVCNTLVQRGYRVLEADSPLKAASVARTHAGAIHLLLTDVVMPQMSGKALAEHVVAVHPETRVLYMSGYTDDAFARQEIQEPKTFLLQKPFTTRLLLLKVREVLNAESCNLRP